MTLQQLKYFIEVVNAGSINKAAENLLIAQPSLSSVIKQLEAEIGAELFLRSAKGVSLTDNGTEFLGYARQIIEQTSLLEQRYLLKAPARHLSISTQHYDFVVNAFVKMMKKTSADEYEFILRETRTYEILEDVRNQRSEIGILYMSAFNKKVMEKFMREDRLDFHPLFTAKPHIFVGDGNPLAKRDCVTLADLEEYPCLSFEQGNYNSFYFSEEIQSATYHKKNIRVSDRATIFSLMLGLDGYTISTGIVSADLSGKNIVAVPLLVEEPITVGWIAPSASGISQMGKLFLGELTDVVKGYDVDLTNPVA